MRALRKRPGFACAVVLTLGAGIGATASVVTIATGLLLSQIPYGEPSRLVVLTLDHPGDGPRRAGASYPEIRDWREQASAFSDLAAFGPGQSLNLSWGGHPQRVPATFVSANYFDVLGVVPALGRWFSDEEDAAVGSHPVAVLSHALWQRGFGGDPAVIGASVRLDQRPYTVIGVAPRDFQDLGFAFGHLDPTGVWLPAAMVPVAVHAFYYESRRGRWMSAVARLRPEASLDEARHSMAAVARRLAADFPDTNRDFGIDVSPVSDHFFGFGRLRRMVTALALASALVLLTGAANVANLSLIRSAERRRDMAVRLAVGAGRGDLARQVLTESTLLALAGGALGLLLGAVGTKLLLAASPVQLPDFVTIETDIWGLAIASALSLSVGLGAGLVPALRAGRGDLRLALGGDAHGTARGTAPGVLVVAEIAAAAALLVSSGLMVRSLLELHGTDYGFRTDRLLTLRLHLPLEGYAERAPRRAVFRDLTRRLSALPGVDRVELWGPALPGRNESYVELIPEGRGDDPRERVLSYEHRATPGAARGLGLPLVKGRYLEPGDGESAPLVALVSRALAESIWPGEDALGRRFRRPASADAPWIEVVGIVADAKQRGRRKDDTGYHDHYLSLYQITSRFLGILLWTSRELDQLTSEVRHVVAAVDPELPLFDVATMGQRVAEEELAPRFYTALMAGFAGVTLLLALVGVYGALAYWARLRRREFGVRLALGARRRDLLALMARRSGRLIAAGLALGLLIAAVSSQLLSSLLYRVSATDPLVFAAAPLLVLVAAAGASTLPARRAARVDPAAELRAE